MSLRLGTMAQSFRDLLTQAPGSQLSFSEQVAIMVDREWTDRENRRLERLMRAARLSVSDASLENVWCDPARGIDKAVVRDLATGKWIQNKQNVIVVGKTGVGKTFVGAALAQAAYRNAACAPFVLASRVCCTSSGSPALTEATPRLWPASPSLTSLEVHPSGKRKACLLTPINQPPDLPPRGFAPIRIAPRRFAPIACPSPPESAPRSSGIRTWAGKR